MNSEEFVSAIKIAVRSPSARGALAQLTRPSGRCPDPELVQLSTWYNSLSESDRASVGKVADYVADLAVFSFLCVLDGVTSIEPAGPKGNLILKFCKDGHEDILNPRTGEMLHDIYKAEA